MRWFGPGEPDGEVPLYSPSDRAERVVATGRLVLAVASLGAVWLDPTSPTKFADLTYSLLAGYAAYSVLLTLVVWRFPARTLGRRLVTHIFDLVVFTAVIYLTEGATSPFFLYFLFSLLSATVRFQLRGTFWTALGALAIFIGMGLYTSLVLEDPDFELNRFFVRSVYLAIVAILLIYLSIHQEEHRYELSRLASWPRELPDELDSVLQALLESSRATLRARCVALLWAENAQSARSLVWLEETQLLSVSWEGPELDPRIRDADFYCRDLSVSRPLVIRAIGPEFEPIPLSPLTGDLVARFDPSTLLSVRFSGAAATGRLFVFDLPDVTSDNLVLGRIVAEMIAWRLDEFFLRERLRRAAVGEERIRVSRELHDGILQSFTGMALQLRIAERVLEEQPQRAVAILGEMRELIVQNQRELRSFVRSLRDEQGDHVSRVPLDLRVAAIAERAGSEWGMKVDLELDGQRSEAGEMLTGEVALLLHEALANAARHGRASVVALQLLRGEKSLLLRIRDNGIGFPFEGRIDLETMNRRKLGPLTLRERVGLLGGRLEVESSGAGATLEIELPYPSSYDLLAGVEAAR